MADWYCGICMVNMEEVDDIPIAYGDIELPEALGIRCPSCKVEYLLEEYVVNELKSAEEMLEGK